MMFPNMRSAVVAAISNLFRDGKVKTLFACRVSKRIRTGGKSAFTVSNLDMLLLGVTSITQLFVLPVVRKDVEGLLGAEISESSRLQTSLHFKLHFDGLVRLVDHIIELFWPASGFSGAGFLLAFTHKKCNIFYI
jgi:hypothetical protein